MILPEPRFRSGRTTMKKSLTCVTLSVSVWIAACGTLVEFDGVKVRCGPEQATVVSNPAHLRVNPAEVHVCPGYTLTLNLRGPGPGMARTRQDQVNGPNGWLDGDNSANASRIVITVPSGQAFGTYKYTFEADGIGLLDPRIVVP
jgi:hypothetical protein